MGSAMTGFDAGEGSPPDGEGSAISGVDAEFGWSAGGSGRGSAVDRRTPCFRWSALRVLISGALTPSTGAEKYRSLELAGGAGTGVSFRLIAGAIGSAATDSPHPSAEQGLVPEHDVHPAIPQGETELQSLLTTGSQ